MYTVGNKLLAPLYRDVIGNLRYFKNCEVIHVPREFNVEADKLCKTKLMEYINTKMET